MARRTFRWATAGLALGLSVAACETARVTTGGSGANANQPEQAGGSGSPGSPSRTFAFQSSGDARFDEWRTTFAAKADAAGRRDNSIRQVLDGLTPIEESVQVQSFDNQAEFVKPIWDYARTAVSPTRVSNGLEKLALNSAIFDSVEASYAVPREIIGAIWGMESAYGAVLGNVDAAQSLASQAAIGRRKEFNEGELIAIMELIEKGAATRDQFRRGSWAGAVGQTQFMPSTFLRYAADFDKDGREDLWTNTGDAVASAANYLTSLGWKKGEPWAIETTIPEGFDYSLGDGRKLPLSAWQSMGLAPAAKATFGSSETTSAELFLPAGSYGPAFVLFDNFYIIKKYNNADSYALAIGLLADRLAGGGELSRPWPTDIKLLTQQEAKDLQTALTRLGFYSGAVDGLIGRGTRGALQKFQKEKGLVADGFPTTDMLAKVLAAAA